MCPQRRLDGGNFGGNSDFRNIEIVVLQWFFGVVRLTPKAPESSLLKSVEVFRTRLSAGFLLIFYP